MSNTEVRFLSKVVKTDTCWIWTAYTLPNGYGRIHNRKGNPPVMLAHRMSWILFRGSIPEGMLVCHTCDNPKCVNPDHLFIGTHKDNSDDKFQKGRQGQRSPFLPKTRNNKHWNCKLTEDQVRDIRSRKSESRKSLAEEFGTTARYISSVICGVKRKYV